MDIEQNIYQQIVDTKNKLIDEKLESMNIPINSKVGKKNIVTTKEQTILEQYSLNGKYLFYLEMQTINNKIKFKIYE